jgi:hypothetical protein
MGAPNSYSLIQDVHAVGASRYMLAAGPGTSGTGGKNIVRRAVFRLDFTDTDQPIATFSHYGNNSGSGSQGTLFQHSIAIDGPDINTGQGTYSYKWGSYYNPKQALNMRYQGAMSINDGGRVAFYLGDNVGSPRAEIEHSLVIGGNGNYRSSEGGVKTASGHIDLYDTTIVNIPNSASCAIGSVTTTNLYCQKGSIPANPINVPGGADMRKAFGKFLSVWGEPGYDAETSDPIWPFPYENYIAAVFKQQMNSPPGYTPGNNISARGFTTGTSIDGSPQTLTKYIWEMGGQQIPSNIYP